MKFWEYRAYRFIKIVNAVLENLMPNGYAEWFWEAADEADFVHKDDAYQFVADNMDCDYGG